MVLISGNKYACETCIKGHRSSTCRHTDRPLFEIKKKGRPVTQCEHCRELRKTKQVHVKCICESKATHVGIHPVTHKRGHTNIPDSATFPNGLPEALETLVATQVSSEGLSSDSDYGGAKNSCQCKTEGACYCCTPRKSAPRNRKKGTAQTERTAHNSCDMPSSTQLSEYHTSRTPSHILARLAELRPVAPRLTSGPLHDPSCGQTIRHHSHENLSFSPYGRAYDFSHEHMYDQDASQVIIPPDAFAMDPASSIPLDEQIFRTQLRALEIAATSPWTPTSFPSACGCGESCSCPGCGQHNGNSPIASSSAFSSCANPGICNACLDCTILSLPASLPPDTSLSIFDAYQTDSIDEWIRQ
ncbi:copper fist DNA binding domain-containing protein [Collybia nuda]|uniref:Copper fist DNA binding domain-containing protein n=1 Tax=Collybia nuda TaxID=64659 RepID=A0A9P5Y7K8_9AGAR|nr:copper fist DNA binding domain-containing protein [Collybia nuda]